MTTSRIVFYVATLSFVGGLFIYLLFFSASVDYSMEMPKERPCKLDPKPNLALMLEGIEGEKLKDDFPYSLFLDSLRECSINSIRRNLAVLNSLYPNDISLNQQVLSIALTNKLEERVNDNLRVFKPDSLIEILQWAEKFGPYSEIDTNNAMLYQSIYLHWFNYLSNKLISYYETDENIRYDFKFKYINSRLKERKFGCPINKSNMEKVMDNFVAKDYARLINKFQTSSSPLQKLTILFCLIYFIYGGFAIYKMHKI